MGAEDVSQHLRKAGHRVIALEQLPAVGVRGADAVVLELDGNIDARSAQSIRAKLVEPVLIHRRRTEKSRAFLSVPRAKGGALSLDLLSEAVANAVDRTRLLRRIEHEESVDADAPTERMTLRMIAAQPTMIVRPHKPARDGSAT